jgi:hypothetical protein
MCSPAPRYVAPAAWLRAGLGTGANTDHVSSKNCSVFAIGIAPCRAPPITVNFVVATRQQYPPVKKNPGVAGE